MENNDISEMGDANEDYDTIGVIVFALVCASSIIYALMRYIARYCNDNKYTNMPRLANTNKRRQYKSTNNYDSNNQHQNQNQNTTDLQYTNGFGGNQNGGSGAGSLNRKRPSSDTLLSNEVNNRNNSASNVYAGRFTSSCVEDKPVVGLRCHRNSSSSEATGSEDINSSQEHLANKKFLSARQRRQQKRQHYQQQQQQQQQQPQLQQQHQQQQQQQQQNAGKPNNVTKSNTNNNNNNNNQRFANNNKQNVKVYQQHPKDGDTCEVGTTRKDKMSSNNVNNNQHRGNQQQLQRQHQQHNANQHQQQQQQQQQQQDKAKKDTRGKIVGPKSNNNNNQGNNKVNQVKRNNNNGNGCNNSNNNNNICKDGKRNGNGNKTINSGINENFSVTNINGNNNNNNNNKNSNNLINNNSNKCNKITNTRFYNNQQQQKDIMINSSKLSPFSSSSDCTSASSSPKSSSSSSLNLVHHSKHQDNINIVRFEPLRQYVKLNIDDSTLIENLRRFIIDPHLLRVYGFPVESVTHEGAIEVFKCHPHYGFPVFSSISDNNAPLTTTTFIGTGTASTMVEHSSTINVGMNQDDTATIINQNDGLNTNRFEFNDKNMSVMAVTTTTSGGGTVTMTTSQASTDSGNVSPRSLDSDHSCDWNECDQAQTDDDGTTAPKYADTEMYIQQSLAKECVRCKKRFIVDDNTGQYLTREPCAFHWGKIQTNFYCGEWQFTWSCCNNLQSSVGCCVQDLHVWNGSVVGVNGPYTDFVKTMPRQQYTSYDENENDEDDYGTHATPKTHNNHYQQRVYALDCEMSYTGRGLEVTKISVVAIDGKLVYEQFVRPDADIVDYNTRFSGVTESDLNNPDVKTLAEVQRDLLELIDADTILIGHGLDNDLRALRIVHKTIIDTSLAFPHKNGFPLRRALRHLTKQYLHREIQCGDGSSGHSSYEDSRACMELMLWRIRKELSGQGFDSN